MFLEPIYILFQASVGWTTFYQSHALLLSPSSPCLGILFFFFSPFFPFSVFLPPVDGGSVLDLNLEKNLDLGPFIENHKNTPDSKRRTRISHLKKRILIKLKCFFNFL